jgi:oxygen-independent coproporphyrinogen-3 oxidase
MAGIYIHIPFCRSKCYYCNFYSVANVKYIDSYLVALKKEIALRANYLQGEVIQTLYFGGGTPSLLSSCQIEDLMTELLKYFTFSSDFEWTFEMNPEQATLEYLYKLKLLGINRLSIGIQSLDDQILRLLNRKHDVKTALNSIENALKVGFESISIDLIYGILERDEKHWGVELNRILSYPFSHLSAYSLTVEENSFLGKKYSKERFPFMETKAIKDLQILWQISEKYGFKQYEISNFARNGFISKHNFAYWNNVPYLGLGVAAHSYNRTSRQWNSSNLTLYISMLQQEKMPHFEKEELSAKDLANEAILLKLRTSDGIELSGFQAQFGKNRTQKLISAFSKLNKDYFVFQNHRYQLSKQGILFADDIAMRLFEI